MLKQYATSLTSFSAQYGANNSVSYVAANILNEPKLYPAYGDYTQACVLRTYARWWKIAPESPKPFPNLSKQYFTSDDYIEVMLTQKVYIREVDIYEIYNPGALVRILALDDTATEKSCKWFVMWEVEGGCPPITEQSSRIFSPSIKSPPFPSQTIRLEFNNNLLMYYTELDAVQVIGDTEVDVDAIQLELGLDELKLKDDRALTTQTSVASDNGYFDMLPGEVLFIILSHLSIDELSLLAVVSTSFHEHCYNSLLPLHQHLNLQPYWYLLNANSLDGFAQKCTKIQSLNLSWCGAYSSVLDSPAMIQLVKSPTLSRLDLSCCPLNDDQFKMILSSCQQLRDLDISSTMQHLSCRSLQVICRLSKLRRLNMYMSAVDTACIISITRLCSELEYLNLGSCSAILDFNEVVTEIAQNCPLIKGLDLWRAKTLDSEGIKQLVAKSKHLTSLDFGWCSKINGQDGCLFELIENCPHLRKLFLTANRSISDQELFTIAKHCPDMEQLDLLGNKSVTMIGIQRLLSRCCKMVLLDISFCPAVTFEHVRELSMQYPKCSIKKSFM